MAWSPPKWATRLESPASNRIRAQADRPSSRVALRVAEEHGEYGSMLAEYRRCLMPSVNVAEIEGCDGLPLASTWKQWASLPASDGSAPFAVLACMADPQKRPVPQRRVYGVVACAMEEVTGGGFHKPCASCILPLSNPQRVGNQGAHGSGWAAVLVRRCRR